MLLLQQNKRDPIEVLVALLNTAYLYDMIKSNKINLIK